MDLPTELRIQIHHFELERKLRDGSSVEYAVEIKNKEEWRGMLRLQAIKEIDEGIIQPLFAAKRIIIKLDVAGHPNECHVWEGNVLDFTPGLKEGVQDWPAFLKKFPFKRMQTVAPYILRHLNPADRLGHLATEEVHYLQLTYDEANAEAWQQEDANLPYPWSVKQAAWQKAHDCSMTDKQAIDIYGAVERGFLVVAQHFFQLGLSAEGMGRLQERLAATPSKVNTSDFQLSSWTAGLMYASGLMGGYLGSFSTSRQSRVTPLEDVVWEKVGN